MSFSDPVGMASSASVENPDADDVRRLSPRQREILDLKAAGYGNAEIAENLGISESTVRLQVHRARLKSSRERPSSGAYGTRADQERWPKDSFIAGLPDAERAAVLAAGEYHRFEDGRILLVQGEVGDHVYVVTSGLVKVIVEAESGAQTTLAIRSRGDLVGEFSLLDHKPRTSTIRAVGRVAALRISGSVFMDIISRSPAAHLTLTRYLLSKMRYTTERHAAERVWDAKERVAQVLYELAKRHAEPGPDGTLRLFLTQGELGDLAGVTVSTVERVLKDLRKAGAVATRYREITITDMSYLSSIRFPQENPRMP